MAAGYHRYFSHRAFRWQRCLKSRTSLGLMFCLERRPQQQQAGSMQWGQRQELHRNEIVQFDSYSTIKREP